MPEIDPPAQVDDVTLALRMMEKDEDAQRSLLREKPTRRLRLRLETATSLETLPY